MGVNLLQRDQKSYWGNNKVTIKFSKKKQIELTEKKPQLEPGTAKSIKLINAKASKVSWSTSNSKIAKVAKGRIKAIKAGAATITAKYKEKKYKCKVVVKSKEEEKETMANQTSIDETLAMRVGDKKVQVQWEDNDSVKALKELCSNEPLRIQMSMYGGFEQVGSIGTSLPRNDRQTDTEAGDIVLYSGNQLVVFYGSNSWAYTKLGHIAGQDEKEMEELLGNGDVTITLSMEN